MASSPPRAHAQRLAARAAALAAQMPPYVLAPETARGAAAGGHAARRAGAGEAFWQFRPFAEGDGAAAVDWRRSARAGRDGPAGWLVRQREWAAAATVLLWCDPAPGMRWSSGAGESKADRAALLALALAALLLRAGERVRLAGETKPAPAGLSRLEGLALALLAGPPAPPLARLGTVPGTALPGGMPGARLVLLSDFLLPEAALTAAFAGLGAAGSGGALLQILDPAEIDLPYQGRVRFEPVAAGAAATADPITLGRVEAVRGAYADRLAAHRGHLFALAAGHGLRAALHRTDQPAAPALLALAAALAGRAA